MTRLTAAQYKNETKRSKYGNKITTLDGIKFASKREAAYYAELKLREKAGEVSQVELQKRFAITGRNGQLMTTYVADFYFFDTATNTFRCIDVKGYETAEFRLKRKLMRGLLGIEVEVVK